MKIYKDLHIAIKQIHEVEALKLNLQSEFFPHEILDFSNLTELYLEGKCTTFPSVTPAWPKLRTLSIKWPDFKGDLSPLFNLPLLENLKIYETPLKSLIFPLGIPRAPLKFITIKKCGIEIIPEEISIFWQLREANFSKNHLTTLPTSLKDLKNLKRLNLDTNHFTKFPDDVTKISSLHHLSIDHNHFPEEEKDRIQRLYFISPI
jgi:Leucine-rich repeat (LRR) protein